MTDYSMEGRTYRYFKGPGDPLYPFGYGLSYTQFKYMTLNFSTTTLKAGDDIQVVCSVMNTGKYDSDEVPVIIFISSRQKRGSNTVGSIESEIHLMMSSVALLV